MALNPNEFAYIIPWSAQFVDKNGKPLAAGFVEIYQAGTTGSKYISYKNWYGDENAFRIPLDSIGKCVAIGDRNLHYDLYVYNYFGNLEYSRLNVVASNEYGGEVIHDTSLTGDGTADSPLSVVYDGLIRGIVGETPNVSTRVVSTASDGTKIYGISVREGGVAKFVTRENTLEEVQAIIEDGYWAILLETDGEVTQQFPMTFSDETDGDKLYFTAIPGDATAVSSANDSIEVDQWVLDSNGWHLNSQELASKDYVDDQISNLHLDNYEAYLCGKCNNQSLSAIDLNQSLVTTDSLGNDIYITGGGINVRHGFYHADVDVRITGATIDPNNYTVILAGYGDSKSSFDYDNTYAHTDVIHFAFDIVNDTDSVMSLPLTITHSIPGAKAFIESIVVFKPAPITQGSGGSGPSYVAGYGIHIDEYNTITAQISEIKAAIDTKAWHNLQGSSWCDNGDLLGFIVENSSGNYDPNELITIEKWTNEDAEHNVRHYGKINLKAGHAYMLVCSMWFARKPGELAPTLNNIAFYAGGTALGINGARQEFLYDNSQMNEVCPQITAFIPPSDVDTYVTLQCSGGVEWYDFKPDYLWIAALN